MLDQQTVLFDLTAGSAPTTLAAQVRRLLDTQPEATALVFITPEGEQSISTGAFFENAAHYAYALREIGVRPSELVVLVLEHSLDVLYSFWGAIMLGAIPSIFPFLTEKLDPDKYFDSVQKLIQRAGVRAVITYPALKAPLEALVGHLEGLLPLLLTSDLQPGGDPNEFLAYPSATPQQTAFLQHSSGSTGLQKGIMLSHQAVISQIASYSQALRLTSRDVVCSWLPLYHDMGLIAGFIMPIMQGIPLVLMSPFHWVRAPQILLQALQKYHGTLCWLPNFAYNFMAQRIRPVQLEGLDLSSVRAFVNCSEPVRAESHAVFRDRFTSYGLQENALTVCYAMAENTFAVTQTAMDSSPHLDSVDRLALMEKRHAEPSNAGDAMIMVSCGAPIAGTEIKIVDEAGNPLAERQVGEIALRGLSMLSGYYKQPEATALAIRDGWFLTGDMGYLVGSELYITGRKKDLIIVGGKNIYPQDIEAIVSDIEGVKDGRVVAFGVFNSDLGTEDIAVIAEVTTLDEDTHHRIQREVRQQVVKATDVSARYVLLVDPMWLLKTSSGKIARAANREKFLKTMGLEPTT